MATTSFGFRYGALRGLLSAVGMGPGLSSVVLDGDVLHVRMGWAFRASIPVHQIVSVAPRRGPVGGIGVHGWRGSWLVNGTTTGLLTMAVDPPVRAWAVGIPIHLHVLTVSLDDPDALVAALGR
jgi:hypothetical protein